MYDVTFICDDLTLSPLLSLHAKELGLCESGDGIAIFIKKGDALTLSETQSGVCITYAEKVQIFRALSYLPTFLKEKKEICERAQYTFLCYMADCSRNAVMTVSCAKELIRHLSRMGYTALMLYTEDTYELKDYPYFGHMRGRYTAQEIREIDDYAFAHGIELIPCIQTLGHLERIFYYPAMRHLQDDHGVLLAEEDATYALIEAELDFCRDNFRCRKVHIGMDEAHALGRGQYLDKHGYHCATEIMLTHLQRVNEMVTARGLSPMMWSDMFFHMQFGRYTVSSGEISPDVIAKVPKNVGLVYWDYYGCEGHMFDCHHQFGNDVYYAGGAIKWMGYCAHNTHGIHTMRHALNLCDEKGVDKIIVTGWGDNGADASQFSVLPTLLYFAERSYGTDSPAVLDARSRDLFGIDFATLCAFDYPDLLMQEPPETRSWAPATPTKYLLFDDPMHGLHNRHMKADIIADQYLQSAQTLGAMQQNHPFAYALRSLELLSRVMAKKATLNRRMRDAYHAKDRQGLHKIVQELPELICDLQLFSEAFHAQWHRENKPFGLEIQDIRIGGLTQRIYATKERLEGYLENRIDRIEEFEQAELPFWPNDDGKYLIHHFAWNESASPALI
jgi:hypothetical protein